MTVTTDISSAGPYDGDGITTAFLVNFPFLDQTYLKVYEGNGVTETLLTLGVDYTVTGAGQQQGQVILAAPLATGHTLTIIRDVPATQLMDYVQGDALPAESHEKALDKLTMIAQQQKKAQGNALQYPESDPQIGATIPNAAARKNKLLGFGDESQPIVFGIGDGFTIKDGYIHVNAGDGLEFIGSTLRVTKVLRDQVETNRVNILGLQSSYALLNGRVIILENFQGNPNALGYGLQVVDQKLQIKPYQGIQADENGTSAILGEGLEFDTQNQIQVSEALRIKIDATVHFPFDPDFVGQVGGYPKGSVILGADGTTLYLSTVYGNTTDPDSVSASGWEKVVDIATGSDIKSGTAGKIIDAAGLVQYMSDRFAIIYPNGGNVTSPANVTINTRYTMANPFPGHEIDFRIQLQYGGEWSCVASYNFYNSGGIGIVADVVNDVLRVQTGSYALFGSPAGTLNVFVGASQTTTAPCRIKVWRVD